MELKQMSWATFVRLAVHMHRALGKLCSCATSKNWTSNTQFMSMCAPSAGPHGKFAIINKMHKLQAQKNLANTAKCKKEKNSRRKLSACRCMFNLQATYVAVTNARP